ncbi:hypothetical protein [Streptomyces bobili]|uniref:hypothetical protein n=1 Tax=Streptomyces bobili TaxID=67280 RepID=UPI00379BD3F7
MSTDDLRQLAAEVLGEVYFRDNGRRAHRLEVELKDFSDLQFELSAGRHIDASGGEQQRRRWCSVDAGP